MAKNAAVEDVGSAKNCFVIMPISDVEGYPKGHFKEVYEELIKPAAVECGFNVSRADEVAQSNMIHFDVVSKVVKADLCICDLSARNPNVFFELGIRQAFDKPTVLIKDNDTQRVFDVQDFRDITYPKDLRIAETLSKRSELVAAIIATMASHGSGSADVFSLVKLLGLAEAASQPRSDKDPTEARFELLTRQLDVVQNQLSQLAVSSNRLTDAGVDTSSSRRHLVYNEMKGKTGRFEFRFLSAGRSKLFDNELKRAVTIKDFEDLISYLASTHSRDEFSEEELMQIRKYL